jgi:O-antigen/teichoic acid export membrane protein
VRALAGSGSIRIIAMLASFAVGIQLARGLGVEGYGYYGLALALITLASIPGELGLPKLVVREVAAASAREDYRALFGALRWADSACLRISLAIAATVVVAALLVLQLRPSALGAAILLGAPIIPLISLAKIRGGALQGLNYVVLGQVPGVLIRPLLLSLLLLGSYILGTGLSAPGAMALNSLTAAAVLVIAHLWLRKRLPKVVPAEVVTSGRRWLASTIPLALTDGMRTLQSELTILLLGLLAIAADVGLFRIAVVTATIASAPMIVISRVAMPMIARLHVEGDSPRLQKIVTYSAFAQTAGVLLLSLPLLVAPVPLLGLAFGPDFEPAATALRIIVLGQIANAAFGPNAALLNMTHHEGRVTKAMAIALVLNVVTVLLLAATAGITGAAIGFVLSLLCWNVLTWLDARRLLNIETSVLPARIS